MLEFAGCSSLLSYFRMWCVINNDNGAYCQLECAALSNVTSAKTELAGTYHGDANELAEALCSLDKAKLNHAKMTVKLINHARFSLMDHMGAYIRALVLSRS